MEEQPLLNENVKNDRPARRNVIAGIVTAVAVLGTSLVIADKAGYFNTITSNPSFRASDGMVSADPTKKADMGGPMNSASLPSPSAPGAEVKQGLAAPISGTPASGTAPKIPASATGAAVAKQAGVAPTKAVVEGGDSVKTLKQSTGPVLPLSIDVDADAVTAAVDQTVQAAKDAKKAPVTNGKTMAAVKPAGKTTQTTQSKVGAFAEPVTVEATGTHTATSVAVEGISAHDLHTPEGAAAVAALKKAKDAVKAVAKAADAPKTAKKAAKEMKKLEKKEDKLTSKGDAIAEKLENVGMMQEIVQQKTMADVADNMHPASTNKLDVKNGLEDIQMDMKEKAKLEKAATKLTAKGAKLTEKSDKVVAAAAAVVEEVMATPAAAKAAKTTSASAKTTSASAKTASVSAKMTSASASGTKKVVETKTGGYDAGSADVSKVGKTKSKTTKTTPSASTTDATSDVASEPSKAEDKKPYEKIVAKDTSVMSDTELLAGAKKVSTTALEVDQVKATDKNKTTKATAAKSSVAPKEATSTSSTTATKTAKSAATDKSAKSAKETKESK